MSDIDFEAEHDSERAQRRSRMRLFRYAKNHGIDVSGQADANATAKVDRAASDSGAPLPDELRGRFESSLGGDLSGVRVHTGAASASAAESVGARAYATGQDIHVGAGEYDPSSKDGQHLLAHEVAHTVQQGNASTAQPQAKLEVSGPADSHEQEADRAADAMIVGTPTQVSPVSAASCSATHMQLKPAASGAGRGDIEKRKRIEVLDAEATLLAAADVVQHERAKLIPSAPRQFQPSLRVLYDAVTGQRDKEKLSGADRVMYLDAAMVSLEPAISIYRQKAEGATWLNEQLMTPVASLRSSARFQRAMDRVDDSIRIGDKTIEMPGDDKPHEQGAILREELKKLVPTMQLINEQLIRGFHDTIHHEAQAMIGGHAHGNTLGPGTLVDLAGALMVADAYLVMSDEEFKHHLNNIHGFWNGVSTYSEFVKAVAEFAGGAMMTTAAYAAAMSKTMGNTAGYTACAGLARSAGLVFGNIVAGIEIVHGIAVLFDSHATRQQKIDAGVSVSSGAAWFAGMRAGGAALGTAASSVILATYAEIKLMAHLYWEASVGLTVGLMGPAFARVQRDGNALAISADQLAKVGGLISQENDPSMKEDLTRVHAVLLKRLGQDLDSFISDSAPQALDADGGIASYPGSHKILSELFAPIAQFKGATTEETIVRGAHLALEKITWCLTHAGEIVVGSAKGNHLDDVERDSAKHTENHGEH